MKKYNFTDTGKQKKIFKLSLISSVLLAFIPTIIILLIEPINFQKHKIELIQTEANNNSIRIYEDLDNDGKEEHINAYNFYMGTLAIIIYKHNFKHMGQYNLKHFISKVSNENNFMFEDINNDSIKEIILLSQKEDSIFLNIFDYKNLSFIKNGRFITTIGLNNNKLDFTYYWITAKDVTGDNIKEIFFNISAGFALYPRKNFRYDLAKDSLITSFDSGAKQRVFAFNDDSLIFIAGTAATDNCNDSFPYSCSDTCSWLLGYNKDLEPVFEPIPFLGKPGNIRNIFKYENSYFTFFLNSSNSGECNKIIHFDKKGAITNIIKAPKAVKSELTEINIDNELHYLLNLYDLTNNVNYTEYFPDKKVFKETMLSKSMLNTWYISSYDIDKDNKQEHLCTDNRNKQSYIYRNNFREKVKIPLYKSLFTHKTISSSFINGKYNLIITGSDNHYFYEYFKNPNYVFKYPFWLLTYIVSLIFVWVVQLIPKRIMQKQNTLKTEIVSLQLKNTQNQLDPHFTFNALNVVAGKIYNKDTESAEILFKRFSRLMRSSLTFSDKVFRPLSEELQFTEDFLEFQKTRFPKLFSYRINNSANIDLDLILVPKMIVQAFTENCVKHAFKSIGDKGFIEINIQEKDSKVLITIEDNGIGINRSTEENPVPKSGYGLSGIQKQINLINKLYNKSIKIEITDKSLINKHTSGTLISVWL